LLGYLDKKFSTVDSIIRTLDIHDKSPLKLPSYHPTDQSEDLQMAATTNPEALLVSPNLLSYLIQHIVHPD
jgi:hypothetical protein